MISKKNITLESLGFEVDKLETNEKQLVYCKDILDKNTFGYIGSEVVTVDLKKHNVYYENIKNKKLTEKAVGNLIKELGRSDEINEREVSDALYMLLHCALKDKEYETQKEQFYIVHDYIKQLEKKDRESKKIKGVLENALYLSRRKYNNDKIRYRKKYKKERDIVVEFEKWLEELYKNTEFLATDDYNHGRDVGYSFALGDCLKKIQELKKR